MFNKACKILKAETLKWSVRSRNFEIARLESFVNYKILTNFPPHVHLARHCDDFSNQNKTFQEEVSSMEVDAIVRIHSSDYSK